MDDAIMSESYNCYDCEEDECAQPEKQLGTCENAIYCWKSTSQEKDGTKRYDRGCFTKDMAMHFTCKSRGDSRYYVDCCQGPLCNGGVFPALLPVVPEQSLSHALTVLVAFATPLFAVITAVVIVIRYYKRSLYEQSLAHNRAWEIPNATYNVVSQHATLSNIPSISPDSSDEQPGLNAAPAGDSPLEFTDHPTETASETNSEASLLADSSNDVSISSNNAIPAGDSTLKTEEYNRPTEIDSETNSETSQSAGSSDDVSISSNTTLEEPELNATPTVFTETVLVHQSHGSYTDITKQKEDSET